MGRLSRTLALPTFTALAVCLAVPGSGLAKKLTAVAPPGNSGVIQYMEDLPTIKGARPTSSIVLPPGGGSGPSSSPTGAAPAIPAAVVTQLERSGKAGAQAAALAQATASTPAVSKPSAGKPPAAPSTRVIMALAGSTGGGGLGGLLPALLIAILVVVSGIGILHRRRAT